MEKLTQKIGRPISITKEVLQKIEYAFSIGCTDKEACIYADIAPSTFYKYCDDHPDFSERKELLKDKPVLAARMTVVKAIESGDTKMAWLYLERKRAEEFGQRKKVEIEEKTRALTLDEIEAGERQFLSE
jgi:hypothetical protein